MGLFGKDTIDLNLESRLNALNARLDNLAKQGKEFESLHEEIGNDLTTAKVAKQESLDTLNVIESEIDELTEALKQLQAKRGVCLDDLADKQQICADISEKLEHCNVSLIELEEDYSATATEIKRNFTFWNQELSRFEKKKSAIRGLKRFNEPMKVSKLSCLGDLHGWAPGLINTLINLGHSVSILGQDMDETSMGARFADPLKARNSGRNLPKVGLSNHPKRPLSDPTPYFDIEFSRYQDCETCLVVIGDIIDRGDHSELNLEIMRQMQITSPGSLISIIGNHELWLIENDFDLWSNNEERYRMQGRARVGTTIYDPIITGHPDLATSMESSFSILQGALGAYLLSQHYSIIEGLDEPSREKFLQMYRPFFAAVSMNESRIKQAVLRGGWELHDIGSSLISEISRLSADTTLLLPGAYSLVLLNDNLFCHGEINGLSHEQVCFDLMCEKLNWCGQELSILPVALTRGKVNNSPLYYARLTESEDKIADSVNAAKTLFPQAQRYIHGHTVHSKEPVSLTNNFELVNLDLGMTPYYRNLWHDEPYNPNVTPYCYNIILG